MSPPPSPTPGAAEEYSGTQGMDTGVNVGMMVWGREGEKQKEGSLDKNFWGFALWGGIK